MFVPCEVIVRSTIPALRAILARELVNNYGLTQEETARILNVTQAAISYYMRKIRGDVLNVETIPKVKSKSKRIAKSLINGNLSKTDLTKNICELCWIIRTSKIMCHLCEQTDQSLNAENCDICISRLH